MKAADTIYLGGVRIDNVSPQEILIYAKQFLEDGFQHVITTPNPEFIVAAQRDREFKSILNSADLSIADGTGLAKAALLQGRRLHRTPGVDIVRELCHLAAEQGIKVFLLGAAPGVAADARKKLQELIPSLKVVGTHDGGTITNPAATDAKLLQIIQNTKPDILFVAFGHGKQEKWIYRHLDALPTVKIAMGVGGSFDYISGRIPRAPYILQKLGFEWLYRLIIEPKRWRRIVTATIEFPLLMWYYRVRRQS